MGFIHSTVEGLYGREGKYLACMFSRKFGSFGSRSGGCGMGGKCNEPVASSPCVCVGVVEDVVVASRSCETISSASSSSSSTDAAKATFFELGAFATGSCPASSVGNVGPELSTLSSGHSCSALLPSSRLDWKSGRIIADSGSASSVSVYCAGLSVDCDCDCG